MSRVLVRISPATDTDEFRISFIEIGDDGKFTIVKSLNEDEFIRWLFNNRCVGIGGPCYDLARDISHIRGRVIDDSWRNKVLHCVKHHTEWHNKGVSEFYVEMLQERRKKYLEAIGRSEYI